MVSKRAILLIFLLWFAVCYFVLQIFFYDTLKLYSELSFSQFLTRGIFYYFGIPTPFLLVILGLIAFLGAAALFSRRARRLILILAPINGLLICGLNYILNSEICISRDCIGRGFGGMLWAGFFWMGIAAVLPIAWALRSQISGILVLFLKTLLPGIITILVFVILWFSSTNPLRTKIIEWRILGNEPVFVQTTAGSEVLPLSYAPPTSKPKGESGGIPLYVILAKISESFTGFFLFFLFR